MELGEGVVEDVGVGVGEDVVGLSIMKLADTVLAIIMTTNVITIIPIAPNFFLSKFISFLLWSSLVNGNPWCLVV